MADTTPRFREVLPLPGDDAHRDRPPSAVAPSGLDVTGVFQTRLPLPPEDTHRDASRPPERSARGPNRLGDYELLGELARGGMGAVYRAVDRQLGREVAIKVALGGAAADPEELERFAVEARAAARLKHPNIVGIHRVGEEGGAPYLVMDLVPGESLQRRIARDGPLPPRDVARFGAKLARALAFAHGRGVLHRDLKPHNVLLTPEGEPVLTDFGLAKEVEHSREITVTGQVLGTPAYMAPEQARGDNERVDRRADVYGLGATLYAALTGHPPFQAGSAIAVLAKVVEEPVAPPRRARPEVERDLETIVIKCLEKEPAARYDTAQDLADDLERHLAGEPIRARRRGAVERAAGWVRRHKVATAGVVGALALAVVAGVGARVAEKGRAVTAARDEALAARAEVRDQVEDPAATAEAILESRLERGLRWLQAAQRWNDLAQTSDSAAAQVEAAFSLGDLARDSGQWGLARSAYSLAGLLEGDPRLAEAHEALEAARVQAAVAALEKLAASGSPQEVKFELARNQNLATVTLVVNELRAALGPMISARREALLAAAVPTELEAAAGWEPLSGLDEVVAALEVNDVPGPHVDAAAADQLILQALQRLASRQRGRVRSVRNVIGVEGWERLEWAQTAALSTRELRAPQLRTLVEVLGEIGGVAREDAVEVLQAWLRADVSRRGTSAAWDALARLGVDLERRRRLLGTRIGPRLEPEAATEEGESPRALARRAMALVQGADLDGARRLLEDALSRWPDDLELILCQVTACFAAGELETARLAADRAVALRGGPRELATRAWVLASLGELERARRDVAEAERRALDGADHPTWTAIGTAWAELQDHDAALEALSHARELEPRSLPVLLAQAQVWLDKGELQQASSVVAQVLELEPDNVAGGLLRAELLIRRRELDAALEETDRLLALAPRSVRVALVRAELLVKVGRVAEAASVAEEVLGRRPGEPQAFVVLARVAYAEGRFDDSAQLCDLGLRGRCPPRYRVALLANKAQARLVQERPSEALELLDTAAALVPGEAHVLGLRAAARARLGDMAGALDDLGRAIEVYDRDPEPFVARAQLHFQRGDDEAARRDCEAALDRDPRHPSAWLIFAYLAVRRGELDLAEQRLTEALAVTAADPDLQMLRADVRRQRMDLAGAREDLDALLARHPTFTRAWTRRAHLRLQQGDRGGAASDAQQAVRLYSGEADVAQLLPRVLAALGEVEAAVQFVDRALPGVRDAALRADLERFVAQLRGGR